jgi:hypothetical protein
VINEREGSRKMKRRQKQMVIFLFFESLFHIMTRNNAGESLSDQILKLSAYSFLTHCFTILPATFLLIRYPNIEPFFSFEKNQRHQFLDWVWLTLLCLILLFLPKIMILIFKIFFDQIRFDRLFVDKIKFFSSISVFLWALPDL